MLSKFPSRRFLLLKNTRARLRERERERERDDDDDSDDDFILLLFVVLKKVAPLLFYVFFVFKVVLIFEKKEYE